MSTEIDSHTAELVEAFKAYNEAIVDSSRQAQRLAGGKANILLELRRTHSVAEIASMLNLSRQAVNSSLRRIDEDIELASNPGSAESQRLLDQWVRDAIRELHDASRDAQVWLSPFFETDLVLTPQRLEQVKGIMARLKGAEMTYDHALRAAGRMPPYRFSGTDDGPPRTPRRFLAQHQDLGENGDNWVRDFDSIEEAFEAADRDWEPARLELRQQIVDNETGEWRFRTPSESGWALFRPANARVDR